MLPDLAISRHFGYFLNHLATNILLWRLSNLATFWATFSNLEKTGFNHDFLGFDEDIFNFSEAFDVGLLRFQSCFDVDLLGFSKIWLLLFKTWLLLLKTFWQHC